MSSKTLGLPDKVFNAPDVRHGKQFFVTAERPPLASLLWDLKNSEDLSLRKMSDRSGGLVSVSTLHDIMSGKTKELTDSTIAGVARILNISEAQVLAALRGRELTEEEINNEEKNHLWEMYLDIPRQCQKDVMDLLEVLQRNHSISARRERRLPRRADIAAAAGQSAQGRNEIPRHPAVTDTPPDVPLPETTPQIPDEEEGEDWSQGQANNKNGTNGENS